MSRYRSRYEKLIGELPEPNDIGEVSILCPFHEDRKRSASINTVNGLFHCMACEASHNFVTFQKAFEKEHGYADVALDQVDDKVVPDQVIRDLHYALMTNQAMLNRLAEERGLSTDTVRKWQIGWDHRTNRISIPIRDAGGQVRNVRLYHFDKKGQQKMISWRAGFGTARLWPMEAFDKSYVMLCEGEMDRLLLDQLGINAVTSTGGAKTWKAEWSKHFEGMKVRIVYDMDQAGDEGARKAAASIAEFAKEVKVVQLDLSKQGEDITDFFVNYGFSVGDLRELSKKAPVFRKPLKESDFKKSGKAPWVTLGQSLDPKHRNNEVMVPVIVASRRDERLHYPKETTFSCNQDAGKVCKNCALFGSGQATVRLKSNDSRLPKFVGIPDNQEKALTRLWAGVPSSCKVVDQVVLESGTIEEILITPEIDTSSVSDDSMHLVQRAFYVGLGLEYNSSYVIKSKPIPFHKNLKIVHQVMDAVPAQDSIESFEMTPELHEELQIFQAKPGKAKRKLAEIADDLQNHVTKIWDRQLLHIGMDLVWHSVLEFEFDGKVINRGWLEAIVVGDTRTGKSEIARQLLRHYGYGERVSGENTSFAGLVGGAIKYDDAWFVKWGRLPLNDKRLVVIDEVTGMNLEDIARMSNVREDGVADVTKIETQKANARTRALWLSNVRPPKNDLSDYDHGCLALPDLVGMPEDIARFDYALSAARDEVSSTIVNQSHPLIDEQKFTTELCNKLVRWVWSRSSDTVAFEQGAIAACYRHAVEMGEIYDTSLPLVMSENQRIKLARVATAIAGRLFSTDDGEVLIVTEEHVNAARDLLDAFYSKESFGYLQFSQRSSVDDKRREEGKHVVERYLQTRPELADLLTQYKLINVRKVSTYTGVTDTEAEEAVRLFSRYRLATDRGTHGMSVSPELKSIASAIAPNAFDYQEETS